LACGSQKEKFDIDKAIAGEAQNVWVAGEKNPNSGFVAKINPITKKATYKNKDGKDVELEPGQYTTEKPLDPQRASAVRAQLASETGGGLDDGTIHDAVIDIMQDPGRMRQYASFGAKGQIIRDQINQAKAKYLRDAGVTEPEILRQQAIAKGQIKSISDLVGMQNAVSAYETVARANGDRFLDLAAKVNKTNVPLVNSTVRLAKLATGDPDAAEMMQVLQNYQTEVARIIANPRLVGQLTDTARAEVQKIIPANLTLGQATRIINRLNLEFDIRGKGITGRHEPSRLASVSGHPTGPCGRACSYRNRSTAC
jgi:hypothetical protein